MLEVLAGFQLALGAGHLETLEAKIEFAKHMVLEERFQLGEEVLQEVIETSRELYGEEHYMTIEAKLELGDSLLQRGHTIQLQEQIPMLDGLAGSVIPVEAAQRVYFELLPFMERTKPNHEDLAYLLEGLGATAMVLENYDEAVRYFRQSYDLYVRVLGLEHTMTVKSREGLTLAIRRKEVYDLMVRMSKKRP